MKLTIEDYIEMSEDQKHFHNINALKALFESFNLDESALDEAIIDCKCAEASAINNDSIKSQLEYLLEWLGSKEDVEDLLITLKKNK